ncbi:hypothetical protein PV10_07723 [Exophiala mesophila]|uniref:Uncharacterized protein n=1 Tax=Exophiala mesophila TaxID=212818 RepID=A0A0D1Z8P2_EXOME|nr:uncharacterized protein PV10_07723 [Exophiala mesophila]KIV90414.1 hypothetical protein PV10_07723 [Exophiala mesophila]
MTDVRALLAAERQSRRISHPHLQYTKSGILLCTICNLNVKSEKLWDGHLRSANHRKNALASQEASSNPLKRKIEDVDSESPQDDGGHSPSAATDARKKAKARGGDGVGNNGDIQHEERDGSEPSPTSNELNEVLAEQPLLAAAAPIPKSPGESSEPHSSPITNRPKPATAPAAAAAASVDEDEWAAFEREVAPLTTEQAAPPVSYEAATISAAPVSAAQLAEQADQEKRGQLELQYQDDKEEEERRLEEEFLVMEEMEERVRKLKDKREALRTAMQNHNSDGVDTGQTISLNAEDPVDGGGKVTAGFDDHHDDDDDDDDDEEDDWYQ